MATVEREIELTAEQRRIVEWVRPLLETHEDLMPEQILVLTRILPRCIRQRSTHRR